MTQEALKLALDALETELSIDWGNPDDFDTSAEKMHEAIAAIKEALAQPEQELVADDFFKMIADSNPKPFSSPQRTWVGLTDEEIGECIDEVKATSQYGLHHFGWHLQLAKAIEAKLKERNDHSI